MQHKIPPFLTREFGSLKTKEEKDELMQMYRIWKNNDITELFKQYLEHEMTKAQEESDSKFNFISWFHKKEFSSYYKGVRQTVRKLLKQLGD